MAEKKIEISAGVHFIVDCNRGIYIQLKGFDNDVTSTSVTPDEARAIARALNAAAELTS